MEKEKLKSMPKVELHCHLDGSLSRSFISQELGREVDPTELQVAYGCRSLKEYLEKFDLPVQCLQSEKSMRKAGYDFIRSVAAENMKYVEVRFAPLFSAHEGFSTEQVIEALLNGLEDGRKDFGTESNIIVCAMRHQSEEDNLAMFRAARNFLGEGVCCGDLAGDEAAWPMKNFVYLFEEAKQLGLPFVIHAGECGVRKTSGSRGVRGQKDRPRHREKWPSGHYQAGEGYQNRRGDVPYQQPADQGCGRAGGLSHAGISG